MDYETKRICAERQGELIGLFASAFGHGPSPEALAAKHDTGFTGVRDIGLTAYDKEGQPAAYYGVFPVEVRINGASHLMSQSGDSMVHPGHVMKGLFTGLAAQAYEIARSEKILGVFGFPLATSYPGLVGRLKWQHIENFERFRFLVPSLPISELLWRFAPARRILLAWQSFLAGLFPQAELFPGSLMSGDFDCVSRSAGYWSYKMAQPEVRAIRVAGIETVIKFEGKLGLGDINSTDPAVIRRVIRKLKWFCFFAGINRIDTYLSPGSPLAAALQTLSPAAQALPICYLDFSDKVSLRNVRYCYFDMDTF